MAQTRDKERARILVVDDDDQSRELLGELLRRRGYRVQSAEDGERAWAHLNMDPGYALVISDLNMPVMDGLTLLHRIRERLLPVPFILWTGFPGHGVATRARQLRAFAVLTKSHDTEELLRTVELALTTRVVAGKEVKDDEEVDCFTDRYLDDALACHNELRPDKAGDGNSLQPVC